MGRRLLKGDLPRVVPFPRPRPSRIITITLVVAAEGRHDQIAQIGHVEGGLLDVGLGEALGQPSAPAGARGTSDIGLLIDRSFGSFSVEFAIGLPKRRRQCRGFDAEVLSRVLPDLLAAVGRPGVFGMTGDGERPVTVLRKSPFVRRWAFGVGPRKTAEDMQRHDSADASVKNGGISMVGIFWEKSQENSGDLNLQTKEC